MFTTRLMFGALTTISDHSFLTGRKAVLGMVKKSKYGEILKTELEERRTTSLVKFQMKYHIHDIVGAELVEW